MKVEEIKLELANQNQKNKIKFELGLIDDFKSLSSKAVNSGSSSGGNVQDWLDKKNTLISDLKSSLKEQENVISLGNKIKQSVNELGADLPVDVSKRIEGANQWIKEINLIISKLSSFKI